MTTSKIEELRSRLEEIQIKTKVLTQTMHFKSSNERETVMADKVIKSLLEDMGHRSREIMVIMKDEQFKEEADVMKGTRPFKSIKKMDENQARMVFENFYTEMGEIERKNERQQIMNAEAQIMPDQQVEFEKKLGEGWEYIDKHFTAEENKGKCVDMDPLFQEFKNLRRINKAGGAAGFIGAQNYILYLQNFQRNERIPFHFKDKKYLTYLKHTAAYLVDFLKRTQPLTNFDKLENQISDQFEREWQEGSLFGWGEIIAHFRFEPESQEQCKQALFCIPCRKKFMNKNVFHYHKRSEKHVEKVNEFNQKQDKALQNFRLQGKEADQKKYQKIALLEFSIARMKDQIIDIIEDSVNEIRKKQSRNYNEIAMEQMAEEEQEVDDIDFDQDDEEEAQKRLNPKHIPHGWDGKPIPYWLYKLHGLGIQFKCEICGGASYWGRRAFEKHFQEWRHAYGMKCLRIPNTAHFRDITSITDALKLHQKILRDNYTSSFNPDQQEEFEDEDGNILKRKEFADLLKQGLVGKK